MIYKYYYLTISWKNIFHDHPTNSTNLNLQKQLNLHLTRPISRGCRRHTTPPHPDLWRLSQLRQYLCLSFPPVPLHSDLMLLHAACPVPSLSVPLRDACCWSMPLCTPTSQSAMTGTAMCHPGCSTPLCVAPYKSVLLCAALWHQKLPQ